MRSCDLCDKAPATVFWPDDEPPEEQVGACQPCVDWMEANTVTITDPVQLLLSHHLAVNLDDFERLCICGERFEAPGYHRRHVAALIYEALSLPLPTDFEGVPSDANVDPASRPLRPE